MIYYISTINLRILEGLNLKNKNARIILLSALVILSSTAITYSLLFLLKELHIVEGTGSSDAWINFAGSALGSFVMMIVLCFTLKNNDESNKKNLIALVKPYLVCKTISKGTLDDEIYDNVLFNLKYSGIIKCEMENVSNNIADNIKIIDSYSELIDSSNSKKYQNWISPYGIYAYTKLNTDSVFLTPNGKYEFETEIKISERNKFNWENFSATFKHVVIFQFTDIINQTYTQKFEYTVNFAVHNKIFQFELNKNTNSIVT